ncbi:hypothetical protein [Streptomyces sp. URMC 124]|uniref:hypothetical protein n=1 Tax=Streptomyces sp. URMC 124 TaxID=3423405 RepID=UPI003F1A06BA
MVTPEGETVAEIADRHSRSVPTVKRWTQHPKWPAPLGKRGKWYEYDPAAVDAWVQEHHARPAVDLEPTRLYTAQQLEDAGIGITATSIQSDLSRGRWPAPDAEDGNVKRWLGASVIATLFRRRPYRKTKAEPES